MIRWRNGRRGAGVTCRLDLIFTRELDRLQEEFAPMSSNISAKAPTDSLRSAFHCYRFKRKNQLGSARTTSLAGDRQLTTSGYSAITANMRTGVGLLLQRSRGEEYFRVTLPCGTVLA
jgi:hypothetical protein